MLLPGGSPRDVALFHFFAFGASSRPVCAASPFSGGSPVSGPHGLVANGNNQSDGPGTEPTAQPNPRPNPEPRPQAGRVAIEVVASPGTITVSIRGELDLVTMPVLAEHLTLVLRTKPERLVLDMAGTDFIDCGSARLIAGASRSLTEGGRLVIRRPGRSIRRILELTGLDAYCEIEG
jgi:anti-sigma B factor antagonist